MPSSLQSGRDYEQRLQIANICISGKPFTRAAYEKSFQLALPRILSYKKAKKETSAQRMYLCYLSFYIPRRSFSTSLAIFGCKGGEKICIRAALRLTHSLMPDLGGRFATRPSLPGNWGNEEQERQGPHTL